MLCGSTNAASFATLNGSAGNGFTRPAYGFATSFVKSPGNDTTVPNGPWFARLLVEIVFGRSKNTPYPARTLVLPSPNGSYASPSRGPKLRQSASYPPAGQP